MNEAERIALTEELERVLSQVELEKMLEDAQMKGLLLAKTPKANGVGVSGSWLGGEPTLPPDVEWPWYPNEDEPWIPMHFCCQIDLSQIPQCDDFPKMPSKGTLFFFHDPIIAPTISLSSGGSRVIYVEDDVSNFRTRCMPEIPDTHLDRITSAYRRWPTFGYRKWNFSFQKFAMLDSSKFQNYQFSEAVADLNYRNRTSDEAKFRSEFEGFSGAPQCYTDHNLFVGEGLEVAPSLSHVPLLLFAPDNDLDFFNSGFPIIFWILKADLANGIFDNTIVQEGV